MDARLLSADAYATPWFIALVDELVDTLHQSYPNTNWTHLPQVTPIVSIAKPQALYARAACSTTPSSSSTTQGNTGDGNGSGNNNSTANSSTSSTNSSGNNTVLIAAIAGAVGGCLLLAGIIFFFYRRRLKRKHAASPPLPPPPPAPTSNPTHLGTTPIAGGRAQPMQFQGGPLMALATPPSTYVPSSSGDSSSNYNYAAPLSPQWTGMTGATSTHLSHPPSSLHPSSYYTTSSPHSTLGPTPVSSPSLVATPPPWAVPIDPNSQAHPQHPQAFMSSSNIPPMPSPSPGTEKAQFSGYPVPVHQNPLPAWAIDHKRPGVASGPSNSAGPSGSGTGGALPNVLEQPGDTLPPPAYTATPSNL